MATATAVAIRQQEAVARIQKTAKTLAKRFELRLVDLAPIHRDAAIERATQLEAMAELLEEIERKTAAKAATPNDVAEGKTALAEEAPAANAAGKRKGEGR